MIIKLIKLIIKEISSFYYILINSYPDTVIGLKLRHYYWKKKLYKSGKNIQIRKGAGIGHPHKIEVGDNFILGNNSLITANSSYGIYIGNDVGIARNVLIHSANHSFSDTSKPVMKQEIVAPLIKYQEKNYSIVIEDDVWIGSQSVVLPGSIIKKGCIISSGSIVSGVFSEYSVIMGNPARVIKSRK